MASHDRDRVTAYHEAGHAVVARALGYRVESVELTAGDNAGECVVVMGADDRDLATFIYGGPVAGARVGAAEPIAGLDRQYLEAAHARLPPGTLTQLRSRAERIVADRWPDVERIAAALLRRGSLTDVELDALIT